MKLHIRHIAKFIFGFTTLALLSGLQSQSQQLWAQDILPETPEGLEGFRLDPPVSPPATPPANTPPEPGPVTVPSSPASPQPAPPPPSANPQRAVPASEAATPDQGASNTDRAARPQSRPTGERQTSAPARPSDSPAAENGDAPASPEQAEAGQGPALDTADDAVADGDAASQEMASSDPSGEESEVRNSGIPTWLFIAIGVGAAVLLLALFRFIRRRPATSEDDEFDLPSAEPTGDSEPDTSTAELEVVQDSDTSPADNKTASVSAAKDGSSKTAVSSRPELELHFIPKAASLSLARLKVAGDLQIINRGKVMARNVQLHSGMICAGPEQEDQFVKFFDYIDDPDIQPLENIKKGERVTVSIETSMPISDVKSYEYEGRRICVPIMLAQAIYRGLHEGSEADEQFAVMIGHEANPPSEKIGPLRVDLGPRSFDRLGQRPVDRSVG